jgi:hypothetical protein
MAVPYIKPCNEYNIRVSVNRNIIPSYNQQDATFLDLSTSKVALQGHPVSQLVATSRKVAGSIPDGVIGIFFVDIILPAALWHWNRLSF